MQLQEDHQHQRQNGEESHEQLTKLSLCCFLTRDQDRLEISTVDMSQEGVCDDHDIENEYETETDDETQQCYETEQWLIED